MALKETIESIASNLKSGRYRNEADISKGVVMRVLSELGWDIFNPDCVSSEYSIEGRRVDYALCHPARKPAIFVEVKQPGRTDGADQQLFEYAYHAGVPMAILCDGKTWGFYLPAEQGSYEERRVYKLDLLERSAEEAADKLRKYLDYHRTVTGHALDSARQDYRDQNRRTLAQKTIPEAWAELVNGEEPSLIERLASEVETKCGVKPEIDDVVSFVKSLKTSFQGAIGVPPQRQMSSREVSAPALQTGTNGCGFKLNGQSFSCRSARGVMVGLLQKLTAIDPMLPEKCYAHPDNQGRVRTYIARTTSELYPNRPDLEEHSDEFVSGWFVSTNLSRQSIAKVIDMVLEAAGLSKGVQVEYSL